MKNSYWILHIKRGGSDLHMKSRGEEGIKTFRGISGDTRSSCVGGRTMFN